MIPWKIPCIAAGGSVTLAVAGLPVLLNLPPYLAIPAAAVVAVLAAWLGTELVHCSDTLRSRQHSQREAIARWTRAGVLVHLAWICTFQVIPDRWVVLVVVLVVLGGIEYVIAELYEYFSGRKAHRKAHRPAEVPVDGAGRPLGKPGVACANALTSIGRVRAEVLDWEPIVTEGTD